MDIELVFKIAAIGIIVAVLNQLLIRSGFLAEGTDVICQQQNPCTAQKTGKSLCIGALSQLYHCLQYPAQRLCQTEQQPHRSAQRKQQCKRRGVPLQ